MIIYYVKFKIMPRTLITNNYVKRENYNFRTPMKEII